jgi:hypothetical protein
MLAGFAAWAVGFVVRTTGFTAATFATVFAERFGAVRVLRTGFFATVTGVTEAFAATVVVRRTFFTVFGATAVAFCVRCVFVAISPPSNQRTAVYTAPFFDAIVRGAESTLLESRR